MCRSRRKRSSPRCAWATTTEAGGAGFAPSLQTKRAGAATAPALFHWVGREPSGEEVHHHLYGQRDACPAQRGHPGEGDNRRTARILAVHPLNPHVFLSCDKLSQKNDDCKSVKRANRAGSAGIAQQFATNHRSLLRRTIDAGEGDVPKWHICNVAISQLRCDGCDAGRTENFFRASQEIVRNRHPGRYDAMTVRTHRPNRRRGREHSRGTSVVRYG